MAVESLICWHITPSELHALTVALADAEEWDGVKDKLQHLER